MASIRVVKPGLQTTVQDRGRWGLQSMGVPVAGAMDPRSLRIANALVSNDPAMATLEVALTGPELEFEDTRIVAVSGAAFDLWVDDAPAPMTRAFEVAGGSRLRFGVRRLGARAYVAVAGGVDLPSVWSSRSTHLAARMGGLEGRALIAGDRLPLGEARGLRPKPPVTGVSAASGFSSEDLRAGGRASTPGPVRVRVLPGPQHERFAAGALEALQSAPYIVGAESDRMGYRLQGPPLSHARGVDIISDATPLGVLQVPASGQPILLMADRQTTGGYPKIATVISADIPLAAQLAPGDSIAFAVCTRAEAMASLIAEERTAHGNRGASVTAEIPASVFIDWLVSAFGAERVHRNVALAGFTTFQVGGPAEYLVETRSSEEMLTGLKLAARGGITVTILGGGSNVLISDRGVRGLVIRPRGGAIARVDEERVRADAAVTINGLVRWAITHGCAGLEAWAGTPGTVGGAIFGNAHFGGRLIGELVDSVSLANRRGEITEAPKADLGLRVRSQPPAGHR